MSQHKRACFESFVPLEILFKIFAKFVGFERYLSVNDSQLANCIHSNGFTDGNTQTRKIKQENQSSEFMVLVLDSSETILFSSPAHVLSSWKGASYLHCKLLM